MNRYIGLLFCLFCLFAGGCSEQTKKDSPVSTAPLIEQDQHISGGDASAGHLSGAPSSSASHLSGSGK